MIITRRRFLTVLSAAAGGIVATSLGFRWLKGRIHLGLGGRVHRLTDPDLDDTPTGIISEQAVDTLRAATQAFIGYPIETEHYTDFFRWHADTLRGYKTLYERCAALLNRLARERQGLAYVECDAMWRRKILEPVFQIRRTYGFLERLRSGLVERDWRRFDLYIFRPVTVLFANTDAWRLVGYHGWPGTPRGLQRYTQPPG